MCYKNVLIGFNGNYYYILQINKDENKALYLKPIFFKTESLAKKYIDKNIHKFI